MRSGLLSVLALVAGALLSAGAYTLSAEPKPGVPDAQWEKHVQSLVEQLGHDNYQRREAAQRALLQEGPKILPVLDKLGPQSDPEIRDRLRRIRYQFQGFLDDIRRRLAALPEIDDPRLPLPDDLKQLILLYQPRSGDYLLSIIREANEQLRRRATHAFLHTWESMTPAQIQSYLRLALTHYAKLRKQYPQGIDAALAMGYTVRYDWSGWPPDKGFQMQTVTTHFLDGRAYGKPFAYQGPAAGTGWLRTKDLALGKHSFHLTTEYKFEQGGRTYTSRATSPTYDFETVAADTPNDLVAPENPEVDRTVREAIQFSEIRLEVRNGPIQIDRLGDPLLERDPWEPQITWESGTGKKGSLHMPLWKLTRELPVDLCFEVEFHIEGTGDVYEGDPLVVLKGKQVEGYFSPRGHCSEFAKGKEGFIPLRIVLKPSRALALTYTEVTQYYPGTITSEVLKAKAQRD